MPYDIPLLKEAITTFRINYGGGGGRGGWRGVLEELIGLPTSSWRAGWQASTFQRPFELHGVWGHVQMKYRIYLLKFVKRSNSFFSDLKGAGRTKLHLLRGSNLGQATRFSYNTIHWVAKKRRKKHSGITCRFI